MRYKYLRKGKGPVLVLQHGFLSGAAYWHKQIDYFAQWFDVIALTSPGFAGNSEQDAIDSVLGFSEHLMRLVDHAKVKRFHLMGHSMGGMIAQETAIQAGDRINKLVLYGTGPNGTMPGRFEPVSVSRQRVIDEGPKTTIDHTVATWFLAEKAAEDYADGVELAEAASLEAMLGGYTAMEGWSAAKRLKQISNETLILWGEGDQAYKRDQVDQLNSGIAHSTLDIVSGCSHNVHLEKPEQFNKIVKDFLLGS